MNRFRVNKEADKRKHCSLFNTRLEHLMVFTLEDITYSIKSINQWETTCNFQILTPYSYIWYLHMVNTRTTVSYCILTRKTQIYHNLIPQILEAPCSTFCIYLWLLEVLLVYSVLYKLSFIIVLIELETYVSLFFRSSWNRPTYLLAWKCKYSCHYLTWLIGVKRHFKTETCCVDEPLNVISFSIWWKYRRLEKEI